MATVYRFQISMPIQDTLPRNRMTNVVHLEHVVGGQSDEQLESMASDMVGLYGARYGDATKEIQCKVYDIGPPPNLPRAVVVVHAGVPWIPNVNPEQALCLSFAGETFADKRRRGRIYLMPCLAVPGLGVEGPRPDTTQMNWALKFFTEPNSSFPDLGGVDWKFGIWSKVGQHFTQAEQAFVNDEWDHIERRHFRETTRVTATREG